MKSKWAELLTAIDLIVMAIAISCLDSESWIPVIALALTLSWIGLIGLANR